MKAPTDSFLLHRRTTLGSLLGLALILAGAAPAADSDPYELWSHGHPQEAVPGLAQRAQQSDRWDAWLDLGLAAAAAGDKGHAAAWLVMANQRAPEREEPRAALRALGVSLTPSWSERCGPFAWLGCGWPAVVCLALAGLALGYALCARSWRGSALLAGLLLLIGVLPGQLAILLDRRTVLVAVVHDTRLLDSAGNPEEEIPAGTVGEREPQSPWAERIRVHLPDGRTGFLPLADTLADGGS